MLSKHILNTLAYYDVMDYPMTAFEIWKHLLVFNGSVKKKYEPEEVRKILLELVGEKRQIENFQGLFFLRGRKKLVEKRRKKEKISSQKLRKIFRISRSFRLIPFVEFVGVVGRVGMKNAKKQSDLDVLVILSPNRIFLGRFLITILLHFLGHRRHGDNIRDRVCLNHFLVLGKEPKIQDVFACHEYSFMIPVFQSREESFSWEKSFSWIKKYKPNVFLTKKSSREAENTKFSLGLKRILSFFLDFDFLEKKMETWQSNKINKNPKTKNQKGIVIVSQKELAFWPEFENHGPKIWDKFVQNQNVTLD